jgi:hypothetical protein
MAVAADCGVAAGVAAAAMEQAVGDPGVYFEQSLTVAGKPVRFANAFACNDVESLALQWRGAAAPSPPVVLLNARRDRPVRSKRFVDFIAAQRPAPVLFVTGDSYALRYARRAAGANARRLASTTPSAALAELAAAAPAGGLIWGVGNYHGFGARLVDAVAGADKPC